MSLIESASFNSKVIKRIKIKTRTTNKLEDNSFRTTSNKKEILPLKSQRKDKIFIATAFSENNQNEPSFIKQYTHYDKINNNFLALPGAKEAEHSVFENETKTNQTLQIQPPKLTKQASNAQKLNRQQSNRNKSTENKIERNRIVHMNYYQYEQIINQQELSPTYFQNIAKRNDYKLAANDMLKKDIVSIQTKDTAKTVNKWSKPAKKKRVKTFIEEPVRDISLNVIMGCHLGALSNIQIRQKLEEKWIKQQKQTIKKNRNAIFTQQSELVSEVDAKQSSLAQHLSLKSKIVSKQKEKISKPLQSIDWDRIENDKFKRALKRILQIEPSQSKRGDKERLYSYGQQYSERQQVRLLARQKLYKGKQLVLKHKLEWKK